MNNRELTDHDQTSTHSRVRVDRIFKAMCYIIAIIAAIVYTYYMER